MNHLVITLLAGIGVLALASQWLAWRLRLPAILFLLIGGVAIGPVLGILDPDELFGELLFPLVSLSVAAILFEGSLTLRREEIRGHGLVVTRMVTVGFVVTWAVCALAARAFVDMPWPIAILFGAIMVVTGPTVIMPLVRAVRPNARIANILRWEGILIDPVGAILAVLCFNVVVAAGIGAAAGEAALVLARMLLSGLLVGAAFGYLWGLALRRLWVPDYLVNAATLLLVFACFALADLVESEAGLLSVTVMGVWLANMRGVHLEEILEFKETLALLLISGLFVLLAARLDFAQLQALGWGGLGVLAAIQFVARPLKILVCAAGSDLSGRERIALGWIAPRGIVAAAISAVFAIRFEAEGYAGAELLVPLTFVAIFGTVVLQSLTAAPLLSLLGVRSPPAEGLLIAGSGPVPRALAVALHEHKVPVVVADSSWEGIRAVRMAGVPSYFGNPASDHAERHMDLTGIGKLLALSRRPDTNDLLCAHFATEFGRDSVFTLPQSVDPDEQKAEKQQVVAWRRGRRAFAEDMSLAKLSSLLSQGAEIRVTELSEEFDFAAYEREHEGRVLPLIAWQEEGRLRVITAGSDWQPPAGWQVASLILPEGQ